MSILEKAKKEFIRVCNDRSLDPNRSITIHPLSSRDAIGDAKGDFVIKKGKEHVIEATFENACGQAFIAAIIAATIPKPDTQKETLKSLVVPLLKDSIYPNSDNFFAITFGFKVFSARSTFLNR